MTAPRTAQQILSDHAEWACDSSNGRRLVWSALTADERAYLRGAYLRGADLRGADLRGAYLTGAKALVELPVADPRGYRLIATQPVFGEGEWLLTAGCRGPWTVAEAREWWGAPDYDGDPLIAQRYLHALAWWEQHGEQYRAATAKVAS